MMVARVPAKLFVLALAMINQEYWHEEGYQFEEARTYC